MTLPLIGINPNPVAYWMPDPMYIDRALPEVEWQPKAGYIQCSIPISPERSEFVVVWDGAASVEVQVPVPDPDKPGKTKNLRPPVEKLDDRRFRFTAPEGVPTRVSMLIVARGVTIDRPPSLSVVEAVDYEAWLKGARFRPALIAELSDFPVWRVKDLLNTDASTKGWQRMPLADVIAAAELAGAQLWGNIRYALSDEEIAAELDLYERKTSRPSILELGNEPWNTSYPATQALLKRAGGTKRHYEQIGIDAARLARLARGRRIELAIGGQPVSPATGLRVLAGLKEGGSSPADFRHWTTTIYPKGTLTDPSGPLLAMARANDIEGAIANLLGRTGDRSEGLSVAALGKINAQQAKIAADNGLHLAGYEANVHDNLTKYPAAVQDELTEFNARVQRDPRAAVIHEAMLRQCEDLQFKVACWLSYSSPPTRYGYFAVKGTAAEGPVRRAARASKRTAVVSAALAEVKAMRDRMDVVAGHLSALLD